MARPEWYITDAIRRLDVCHEIYNIIPFSRNAFPVWQKRNGALISRNAAAAAAASERRGFRAAEKPEARSLSRKRCASARTIVTRARGIPFDIETSGSRIRDLYLSLFFFARQTVNSFQCINVRENWADITRAKETGAINLTVHRRVSTISGSPFARRAYHARVHVHVHFAFRAVRSNAGTTIVTGMELMELLLLVLLSLALLLFLPSFFSIRFLINIWTDWSTVESLRQSVFKIVVIKIDKWWFFTLSETNNKKYFYAYNRYDFLRYNLRKFCPRCNSAVHFGATKNLVAVTDQDYEVYHYHYYYLLPSLPIPCPRETLLIVNFITQIGNSTSVIS